MNSKIKKYFERYKRKNISAEELREAKGKATFLGELSDKFLLLCRMVESTLRGEYKLDMFNMAMIIGAIVYVVSPIDAIPDFIIGLGYLDDIALITFIINRLDTEIIRFEKYEERGW